MMTLSEWKTWNATRCADSRHSWKTGHHIRLVLVPLDRTWAGSLVGYAWPVRLRVVRSISCWVCHVRVYEPRELVECDRAVARAAIDRMRMS